MNVTQQNMWIPLGIVAAFGSAMSIICDKMGAQYVDGAIIGILEAGATLILLLCVFAYSNKNIQLVRIDRQALPYIFLSAFFTGISWVFYYVIMNYATVSKAASIDQFSLVFVFCLAIVFLGESVTWKSVIGSILLLVGMGFMVL